jgi:uncharacterized protein (TIGR02147 family)
MQQPQAIYAYSSYRDFLAVVARQGLSRRERPISLRQWARKLGYRSPRTIGMVLNGQRLPSAELVRSWSTELGMDENGTRYFDALVRLEKARRKNRPTAPILRELVQLSPDSRPKLVLDAKAFSFIAGWHHLVIKQLIATPGFVFNPERIRDRLGRKVSVSEIKQAVDTMLQLGLIGRSADKRRLKVLESSVTTLNDVPSEAIRMHHEQQMERAREALFTQDVSRREFTGATFQFDARRIAEAKAAIRRFREEFEKKFSSPDGQSVHQLNIQFFSHTCDEAGGKKDA